MVMCSVGITGLVAGIIAVPAGIVLHHNVLPAMAHAANSGLPPGHAGAARHAAVAQLLAGTGCGPTSKAATPDGSPPAQQEDRGTVTDEARQEGASRST
jgi:hypothetical protein